MFTETKGGDGAVQEEEKERRRPGQRGREVDGKGGRDHSVFPFRMVFIVTSNADLQQHPTPKPLPSRRSGQSAPPSSFSLLCVTKWTVIGYSFMKLISPLPQEEALFAAPQK